MCLFNNMHEVQRTQKIEWIIHSIHGVKKFHSLRSEFHSILTSVEWKFRLLNEWNLVRFTQYSLQKKWSDVSDK